MSSSATRQKEHKSKYSALYLIEVIFVEGEITTLNDKKREIRKELRERTEIRGDLVQVT